MSRRTSHSRNQRRSAPAHDPSCPCGLAKTYEECCGRFHRGEGAAPTAEALMRSRYCAFVKRDEAYLLRTWHPRTRPTRLDLDPATRWTALEILATTEGTPFHTTGTVTFRATYAGGSLQEHSRFERADGTWVYVDGDIS
ncbi:YchJ family metal-binding protein [Streptomyces sp. NBC_00414]|uniref:YchJ family protein n=1 Tax=Streptomyces sp. NBC_00414 TaxID=2975739 RepID=UPI002E210E28